MEYTFKKHNLSDAEKLWLHEVTTTALFNPRVAKVKLWGQIPKDFNPKAMDPRISVNNQSTLIGLRLIDPDNELFAAVDSIIQTIRADIIKNPFAVEEITAVDLEKRTNLPQKLIWKALRSITELGRFYSSASGSPDGRGLSSITLEGDESFDEYLRYEGLDDLLERNYLERDPSKQKTTLVSSYSFGTQMFDPFKGDADGSPSAPQFRLKKNSAFVIMAINPLEPTLEDVYGTIKEVFSDFGVRAYRADEIEHQDRITDVILSEIESCEYVIADLSFERPNVYYEIGYAHAKGKKPILIRSDKTKLHFDLSVHNVPSYKNITALREILRRRLSEIFGRDPYAAHGQ